MRVVLDTQVWLDWLVFGDAGVAAIFEARAAGRTEIIIDAAGEAELERVLAYDLGRRTLDAASRAKCLARCRGVATRIEARAAKEERARLPQCRDPDDQKFLELALAARADLLVTRDRALLELARRPLPFRIVMPDELEVP